jgi:tetratricopeptide (TPR) repeat protein
MGSMTLRGAATTFFMGAMAIAAPGVSRGGTALQVPVGPRGIAMGGAFTAIADDATAPFWNPAGLPWITHQEVSASHADLFGSGIKDDYASFVLPLSWSRAAAVDFYHSGFGDTELDFGESRIDLTYGQRLLSKASVGASVKYLGRHTDLDGLTVRQGSGFGLDLGVLYRPVNWLRLAAVAQDVFDTRISYAHDLGSSVAYPRTLRLGAAWLPVSEGALAVDVDDHIHLGAEYTLLGALALRAGLQDDLDGIDGLTESFGAGVRWNTLRFDYALEDHPVLGTTHHFGLALAFNFNPSLIRIERVTADDIYTSLYRSYPSEAVGTARVRNFDDEPVIAKVRVLIPDLMREPSEQDIVLRPRAVQDVPLTVVLPDGVMARSGDRPVQLEVTALYQSLRLPRTEKAVARCTAYGPGAIDWSQGLAQAAAFVTPRDPVVESVARAAVHAAMPAGLSSGIRNLDHAAEVFDAVQALGVTYVPDPNNPYAAISELPKAVDTIYYPSETISRRAGDCDDMSVLFAALLGNVGIRTKFVGVPGHVFLLVSTDVHERNRPALGIDEKLLVVAEDEVWIPLETTALGDGFAAAWRSGADAYASWAPRGRVELVDVGGAQLRYPPAILPRGPEPPALDTTRLTALVAKDAKTIQAWRSDYLAAQFGDLGGNLHPSPAALNEVARVYLSAGHLEDARDALRHALADEPGSARTHNNLGVCEGVAGDLERASDEFRAATALAPDDPGPWLNLGLARYAAGDSTGAEDPLDRGIELSGGYAEACALLGIPTIGSEEERSGTKRLTAEEARQLLKAALQRVPRAPAKPPERGPHPRKSRTWTSRTAGGRSSDRGEVADLLYWMP